MPDFSELLQINQPNDQSNWLVLHGFWSEEKKYSDGDLNSPYLNGWFRIETILIKKHDYASFAKNMEREEVSCGEMVRTPSTFHEGFFGEYPWHDIYRNLSGWAEPEDTYRKQIAVKHLIPYVKYEWEDGVNDFSLDSSLGFHMPAKELINDMGLVRRCGQWGRWESKEQLVFCDPCVDENGPSYALIKTEEIQEWLEDNDMEIVWLISGGKEMIASAPTQFLSGLVYSGVFRFIDGKPKGDLLFKREME